MLSSTWQVSVPCFLVLETHLLALDSRIAGVVSMSNHLSAPLSYEGSFPAGIDRTEWELSAPGFPFFSFFSFFWLNGQTAVFLFLFHNYFSFRFCLPFFSLSFCMVGLPDRYCHDTSRCVIMVNFPSSARFSKHKNSSQRNQTQSPSCTASPPCRRRRRRL